jgi:predicted nuclease with RNAse H fold
MSKQIDQFQVESLLAEKDGYLRRGLTDRAKQVDEVLESLGVAVREVTTTEPKAERAVTPRATKRKA